MPNIQDKILKFPVKLVRDALDTSYNLNLNQFQQKGRVTKENWGNGLQRARLAEISHVATPIVSKTTDWIKKMDCRQHDYYNRSRS